MIDFLLEAPNGAKRQAQARAFVAAFLDPAVKRPKLLFGRNVYAESVIKAAQADAVLDDFATEATYHGLPVIRSDGIPRDALVLAVPGGKPLTIKDKLDALNVENLDYFAFRRFAPLPLAPIVFNEGFEADFGVNHHKYQWISSLLSDEYSRWIFRKLVSFRLNNDVEILRGFIDNEANQYFEDFLALQPDGEVFHDIGCFDGATSLAFAKLCPRYSAIHAFEPEESNFHLCERNLAALHRVTLHPIGLSSVSGAFSFCAKGSASSVSSSGNQTIRVEPLDSLTIGAPTFMKIDIEGAELECIGGASRTI